MILVFGSALSPFSVNMVLFTVTWAISPPIANVYTNGSVYTNGCYMYTARFIYGSTTTQDGSATIHHGVATNAHDTSMIWYGASTIQAGSATVASWPPTIGTIQWLSCDSLPNYVTKYHYLFNLWRSQSCHQKKKLRLNQNSHRTHWLGSVLSQVQCHVQLYQMTSSSSCKLAIWSLCT